MIIEEMHKDTCRNHAGSCALTAKKLKAGYLWPTIKQDYLNFVQKCDKCQGFGELKYTVSEQLHCSKTSQLFHKWCIDILGPFSLALGQLKYLVVAIDYFTKWIEAEPLPIITTEKVRKFVQKRTICRYRVPYHLVSNNGTQFTYWRFEDFCRELGIVQLFSSVEHPQTNGLVANKVIIAGLKKRMEEAKGLQVDDVHAMLQTYHTTPHSSTQETPYRLVYELDAVIPIELLEPGWRTLTMIEESNELSWRAELDLVEEDKEKARIKEEVIK